MADLITIKSGALGGRATMPKLNENELGYRTDEEALYIGADKNVRLCGANDVAVMNALIDSIRADIANINQEITNIKARLDALPPSE